MEYFVVGGFSGFWVTVLSEVIPRLLVGILVHFQHFPKFPLEFNRTYFNPRVGTAGVKCLSHERNKVNSTQVLPWPLWVKHTIDRLFDVAIAVSYMKLYLWLSFCSHKFNEKMLFIATHSSELRDTYSEKWKSHSGIGQYVRKSFVSPERHEFILSPGKWDWISLKAVSL